ncbi:MAG: glucose-6-phosphate isomerase [Candidatus Peregrinibacteria bacterium]|nr:glucose-6-phosphate isomerase [Candidatus Peregrinibacteria bacterium]
MITLDYSNLFKVKNPQITEANFKGTEEKLSPYLELIKTRNQGFYDIVNEDVSEVLEYAASLKGQFDDIIVLGIGGSSLGNICLKDTLAHPYGKDAPRLCVLDNVDPYMIEKLDDIINYDRALFITISKSGDTPEPVAEYLYFRKKTDDKELDPKKHHVFITGPHTSFLHDVGVREGIKMFPVPENVGGRFSVLTNVGLLPAALIGIDIQELLRGGKEFAAKFLSENFDENISFQFATIQYLLNQNGVNINIMMPYTNRLRTFADWYSQLLAESIGKATARDGSIVNTGITPVAALGTVDQHSQVQLYNEGPRDKMIIFLEVENHESKIEIPHVSEDHEKTDFLKGITFENLINTELHATQDAVTKYEKANVTFKLDKIDAYNLGALFLIFEGATAFLGEFYGIDAFNQPGVELGKVLTRQYLIEKK